MDLWQGEVLGWAFRQTFLVCCQGDSRQLERSGHAFFPEILAGSSVTRQLHFRGPATTAVYSSLLTLLQEHAPCCPRMPAGIQVGTSADVWIM